jgi:hypothetical protein
MIVQCQEFQTRAGQQHQSTNAVVSHGFGKMLSHGTYIASKVYMLKKNAMMETGIASYVASLTNMRVRMMVGGSVFPSLLFT